MQERDRCQKLERDMLRAAEHSGIFVVGKGGEEEEQQQHEKERGSKFGRSIKDLKRPSMFFRTKYVFTKACMQHAPCVCVYAACPVCVRACSMPRVGGPTHLCGVVAPLMDIY